MLIRSVIYLGVGLILVVLGGIANTRLGWHVDIAWLLIAAAVFAHPPEFAPIAGLTFGLILDGLSGSSGFYAISYAGLGTAMVLARKGFFLGGFVPAWIMAVVGSEIFWLLLWLLSRSIKMIGGAVTPQGFLSPYILTTAIFFPLAWLIAKLILIKPKEPGARYYYGATVRMIDHT